MSEPGARQQKESHYLKEELYRLVRDDPAIFDFLQAGSLDGVWYWDLTDPVHEWMSPRFWQVFGYDPADQPHEASAWQDMIDADDLQACLATFERHCEDPKHPYDQIVRYRHRDGSTVWVRCRGIAIRDAAGTPVRMLGAHTDLTRQYQAIRQEQLLGRIRDRILDLRTPADFSAAMRQEWVEELRAFGIEIKGLSIQLPGTTEATFTSDLAMFLGESSQRDLPLSHGPWVEEAWRTGQPVLVDRTRLDEVSFSASTQYLIEIPFRTGGSLGASTTKSCFTSREQDTLVAFSRLVEVGIHRLLDLQAVDEARAQAEARSRDLERSNQELEQFAYVASHDLREPLRTVTEFLELLDRRYGEQLDDDAKEFVDLARVGARRMQRLIDDLLSFARLERAEATLQPTDLEIVMDRVKLSLDGPIHDAGATVTWQDLPNVQGDEGQLERLLMNLVGNAIKHVGEAPPTVRIAALRSGPTWEISVTDEGPGIDPSQHERIFERFVRLSDRQDSTGLGLAICRTIVERHGGRLRVESQPGQGATFIFTLPAIDDGGKR